MAFAELEPTIHYEHERAADGRLFSISEIPENPHLTLVPDLPEPGTLAEMYMQATDDLLGHAKTQETDASRLDPYYLVPAHQKDLWNGLGQIGVESFGDYVAVEDTAPGTHVATLSFNPVRSAWLIAITRQQGTRDEALVYQNDVGDLKGNFVTYDAAGRATGNTALDEEDLGAYERFLKDALRPEVIGRQIKAAREARDMVRRGIEEFFAKADMEPSGSWLELSEDEIKRAASIVANAKARELTADGKAMDEQSRKDVAAIYRSGEGLSELRKEVINFPLTHMTSSNTPPLPMAQG